MAAGSFGRSYLEYLERNDLDPTCFIELQESTMGAGSAWRELGPERDWLRERSTLAHDLWHVLTGYGTDELGEATLLWFSLAQSGGTPFALLSIAAALSSWRGVGREWPAYVYRAWRRGRRAVWLAVAPYEELLELPLDAVRYSLAIEPPLLSHPGGILRGSRGGVAVRVTEV